MPLDSLTCDFGRKAPAFNLSDPDGKMYSLDDVMGEKGLLVAFICNHCPYVQAIIDRLVADAKALQEDGIGVVGIMSNDYTYVPSDSPDNMKKFAAQHGMTFPYLVDETQEIGKAYDAVCTPDFFGFNADRELQYRGRLDDARMDSNAEGRTPELLDAMRLIAKTGKGPEAQEPSMGCSIKWKE
ncbi:MAG: thioredoxin family protein [Hyphomicrobiales bacterium]|nr:thioredoxin family protein [Hyphomicrobiales bacterium]MCY4033125.1 thioredoxin family protein [Hyphomicrobiales bacterium]MCY4038084.1 thioredoxin family protein [Hyphomicrobiales bacterium]